MPWSFFTALFWNHRQALSWGKVLNPSLFVWVWHGVSWIQKCLLHRYSLVYQEQWILKDLIKMGQKLHFCVRKVNHIPRIIGRGSIHLLLGSAGSYLGPHGWDKSFHWSSAGPFIEASTGQPWIPLANWPHCKKRLESEMYENLPMLEEAFQQTEV